MDKQTVARGVFQPITRQGEGGDFGVIASVIAWALCVHEFGEEGIWRSTEESCICC